MLFQQHDQQGAFLALNEEDRLEAYPLFPQILTRGSIGANDGGLSPFSQESFGPNNAPGRANLKDDDYDRAGTYPSPVGVVVADENIAFMERAVTSEDPRVRIHFPLTAAQSAATSRLRITVDLIGGGAWINGSLPGFSIRDVVVTFNGQPVGSRNGITSHNTLTFTIPASSVAAVSGENVLQIERTGGAAGGCRRRRRWSVRRRGNHLQPAANRPRRGYAS